MREIPADVSAAIEALQVAAEQLGGQMWIEGGDGAAVTRARADLEATILRHLPRSRPELSADDAEALRMGGDR